MLLFHAHAGTFELSSSEVRMEHVYLTKQVKKLDKYEKSVMKYNERRAAR